MSELVKPQINLKEQPTVTCEKCGGTHFKEIVLIKKVVEKTKNTWSSNSGTQAFHQ